MPTLVIKGKITKGYEHWLEAFDGSENMRNSKYGIKCLYRGYQMDDPNTIHVVLYTPSMEIIQQHKENDAELIAKPVGIQALKQTNWLSAQIELILSCSPKLKVRNGRISVQYF